MHPYYKKSEQKLKKEANAYLKLIAGEIERIFQKPYKKAFEEIWRIYSADLMEKFPYIGGSRVSGTSNLTGAYIFVAFGEAAKKYGLSLDEWGQLTTICFEKYFDAMPALVKNLKIAVFKRPKLVNKMLKKKDAQNRKNALKNPGSFETLTQEPTAEFPINFHTLVCPLYNFAKANGYMDYMPYLCNLDYVMFGKMGVSLYRENTCACGDGYCDFKMKKNAPIPAFWPPHILDKNDPLK
ncbi:L-2-amino-thiazoline-4-carboxylic acid hydrolase [Treponema sp. OMZ 840]|uniref:L-2-amino-thiazoline-4-carboxylic acid hydrolase n=1 Tax=Treponema sp. OMZ 840 TaxID=244313 RepID=UPI003D8FE683